VLTLQFIEVGQDLADLSDDLDAVLPMAYFKDRNFDAGWVGGKLINDVERKRTLYTVVQPNMYGSGTAAQNVSILTDLQKSIPMTK
jgi:hypothetical protein